MTELLQDKQTNKIKQVFLSSTHLSLIPSFYLSFFLFPFFFFPFLFLFNVLSLLVSFFFPLPSKGKETADREGGSGGNCLPSPPGGGSTHASIRVTEAARP